MKQNINKRKALARVTSVCLGLLLLLGLLGFAVPDVRAEETGRQLTVEKQVPAGTVNPEVEYQFHLGLETPARTLLVERVDENGDIMQKSSYSYQHGAAYEVPDSPDLENQGYAYVGLETDSDPMSGIMDRNRRVRMLYQGQLQIGVTEVHAQVIFEGEGDPYSNYTRPDNITVQLLRNDVLYSSFLVSTSNPLDTVYPAPFLGLPKYAPGGGEYMYTIASPDSPDGYDKRIDGFDITLSAYRWTQMTAHYFDTQGREISPSTVRQERYGTLVELYAPEIEGYILVSESPFITAATAPEMEHTFHYQPVGGYALPQSEPLTEGPAVDEPVSQQEEDAADDEAQSAAAPDPTTTVPDATVATLKAISPSSVMEPLVLGGEPMAAVTARATNAPVALGDEPAEYHQYQLSEQQLAETRQSVPDFTPLGEGVYRFTLPAGGRLALPGLPEGTRFTVAETGATLRSEAFPLQAAHRAVWFEADPVDGAIESFTATGRLEGDSAHAVFRYAPPQPGIRLYYEDTEGGSLRSPTLHTVALGADFTAQATTMTGYRLVGEGSKAFRQVMADATYTFVYQKLDDAASSVPSSSSTPSSSEAPSSSSSSGSSRPPTPGSSSSSVASSSAPPSSSSSGSSEPPPTPGSSSSSTPPPAPSSSGTAPSSSSPTSLPGSESSSTIAPLPVTPPTGGDNGGKPSPTESDTPSPQAEANRETLQAIEDAGVPILSIGGGRVPLFSGDQRGVWSLFHLMATITSLLLTVVTLLRWLARRGGQGARYPHWALPISIISLLCPALSLLAFLLTQNLSTLMVLLDGYSLLFALALVVQCVLLWLGQVRATSPDEEDEGQLRQDYSNPNPQEG